MKSILILIALLIVSLTFIESKPIRDDDPELFMNFDEKTSPLMLLSDEIDEIDKLNEHFYISDHHHKPKYPKHPKHPKHPKKPTRAYTRFPSPPDIAEGVVVFVECRNTTLVFGQFTRGFV